MISDPHHHLLLFDSSKADVIEPEVIAAATKAMNDNGGWLKVFVVASKVEQLPDGVQLLEDPHGALSQRYGGDVARLYLIRPDGYIAYRSGNVNGLDEYLQRVMN